MPRVRQPKPAVPPLIVPTKGTLRKYGMTVEEWREIAEGQGWVCAICRRVPQSGRLCIDHEHVRGWKRMKPEDRRRYVRGVICFLCNGKCVNKWMTVERAAAVLEYLTKYRDKGANDGR